MSRSFNHLIETQTRKAQAEGQLDTLAGAGKPLPKRPGEESVDPALAAGMRIMAQAGALPEEFEIRKQIAVGRARYQAARTETERKAAMAKLADLDLKLNIAQEARAKFFKT